MIDVGRPSLKLVGVSLGLGAVRESAGQATQGKPASISPASGTPLRAPLRALHQSSKRHSAVASASVSASRISGPFELLL